MIGIEKFFNNVLAAILLTAMMLLVSGDVIGRYLFNAPIHGTTEITEFLMIGLFYFTLGRAQALRTHIRVEFLFLSLSPRGKLICDICSHALGFFIFALIAWQTLMAAVQAWKIGETTFGVILFPLFPAKILVPLGSLLFCLRLLKDIVEDGKKLRGEKVA